MYQMEDAVADRQRRQGSCQKDKKAHTKEYAAKRQPCQNITSRRSQHKKKGLKKENGKDLEAGFFVNLHNT